MWDRGGCYCTGLGECADCLIRSKPFSDLDHLFVLDDADQEHLKAAMILDGVPEDCHLFQPKSGLFHGVPPLSNIMFVLRLFRVIPRWTYKACLSIYKTHIGCYSRGGTGSRLWCAWTHSFCRRMKKKQFIYHSRPCVWANVRVGIPFHSSVVVMMIPRIANTWGAESQVRHSERTDLSAAPLGATLP